jgi:predicted nuclease of predicted toxin-antitoxin system
MGGESARGYSGSGMKLLIDMNLSPDWVRFLFNAGVEAIHWSAIGAAIAPDTEIVDYASAHGFVVLAQDLDFGVILAITKVQKPSVMQIRSESLDPNSIGKIHLSALVEGESSLESGVLLTLDSKRTRMRLLAFPSI